MVTLEVALEMLGHAIYWTSAPGGPGSSFYKSAIYLNPDDYDGAAYSFEITVKNGDAATKDIRLIDTSDSNATLCTITVDASADFKTFRGTFAAGWSGVHVLAIAPSATTVASYLADARILVAQTNATKTRIQIPMLCATLSGGTSGALTDANSSFLENITTATYAQLSAGNWSIFRKDMSRFADIASGAAAWSLEVISDSNYATSAKTSMAALVQAGGTTVVTGAEVTTFGMVPTLAVVDFANDAANFSDTTDFEVKHKAVGGNWSYIWRASLYVRLTSLTRADVWRRIGGSGGAQTAGAHYFPHRQRYVSGNYSSSTCYLEATGSCNMSQAIEIDAAYSNGVGGDTASTGSDVSSSGINWNAATKARQRSSPCSLADGDRFWLHRHATSTVQQIYGPAFLVVAVPATTEPTAPTTYIPRSIGSGIGSGIASGIA